MKSLMNRKRRCRLPVKIMAAVAILFWLWPALAWTGEPRFIGVGYLAHSVFHLPLLVPPKTPSSENGGIEVFFLQMTSASEVFNALEKGFIAATININLDYLFYRAKTVKEGFKYKVVGPTINKGPYSFVKRGCFDNVPVQRFGYTFWAPVQEKALRDSLSKQQEKLDIDKSDRVPLRGSFDKIIALKQGELDAAFIMSEHLVGGRVFTDEEVEKNCINGHQGSSLFVKHPFLVLAIRKDREDEAVIKAIREAYQFGVQYVRNIKEDEFKHKTAKTLLMDNFWMSDQEASEKLDFILENDIFSESIEFSCESLRKSKELYGRYFASVDNVVFPELKTLDCPEKAVSEGTGPTPPTSTGTEEETDE